MDEKQVLSISELFGKPKGFFCTFTLISSILIFF